MLEHNAPTLRALLRHARREMSVAQRQRASLLIRARLHTWLALVREQALSFTTTSTCPTTPPPIPSTIAAFWPLGEEPDLTALLDKWRDEPCAGPRIQVLLPVVQSDDQPLAFYPYTAHTKLAPDKFGVMTPISSGSPDHNETLPFKTRPDVVLVPTLGFTEQGDRIGYGKGFYDRTLHALKQDNPALITVGVAFDQGHIESITPNYQPQPHDFRLDHVITPTQWWPQAHTES